MFNLKNKTVLITGASSGVGKACAEQFAALGARVIITARRMDRLTDLTEMLRKTYGVDILPLQLDISDHEQVSSALSNLPSDWASIDILLNNAGLSLSSDKFQEADIKGWETVIDTNIKGLLYVTRAIITGMITRGSGQIINIGSTAAHDYYPGGNVYCATKHAVKAITHGLRLDLLGTSIRVSEVDPGAIKSEFNEVRWKGDMDKVNQYYRGYEPLMPEDVARSVIFCAVQPPHVNIAEIIVYPTAQASVHHLHREGDAKSGGILG